MTRNNFANVGSPTRGYAGGDRLAAGASGKESSMTEPVACKACGQQIIFVDSPNGNTMPLTARPVTVYHQVTEGDLVKAIKVETERPVYVSHFATCTNPRDFSRRQGGAW
jgi:hypothetical protein